MTTSQSKRMLKVLIEFCNDVEVVGKDTVGDEWPDLLVTYTAARQLLDEVKMK